MNFKKQLREGLLTNNPVVGQLLGMCSTMAITTTLFNGLGMGLSVTLILICSNVVISLLRKVIPDKIRIAAYIVVIAGFVTIVDLLLQAYVPALSASLGVFIPLIVVIPGITAYVLFTNPHLIHGLQDSITTADSAYPWLLKNFTPTGIKGLAFAALVAAIVSSLASMINSTATIFTMDIYKRLISPEASE